MKADIKQTGREVVFKQLLLWVSRNTRSLTPFLGNVEEKKKKKRERTKHKFVSHKNRPVLSRVVFCPSPVLITNYKHQVGSCLGGLTGGVHPPRILGRSLSWAGHTFAAWEPEQNGCSPSTDRACSLRGVSPLLPGTWESCPDHFQERRRESTKRN